MSRQTAPTFAAWGPIRRTRTTSNGGPGALATPPCGCALWSRWSQRAAAGAGGSLRPGQGSSSDLHLPEPKLKSCGSQSPHNHKKNRFIATLDFCQHDTHPGTPTLVHRLCQLCFSPGHLARLPSSKTRCMLDRMARLSASSAAGAARAMLLLVVLVSAKAAAARQVWLQGAGYILPWLLAAIRPWVLLGARVAVPS